MNETPIPEPQKDKPETGACSSECYRVEARIGLNLPPRPVGDQLFDGQWRRVNFARGFPGVPVKLWNHEAAHLGYLTYEAAMSLAYWFAAEADASCVEIRLVRYRFDYSYSVHHVAVEDPIAHGAFRYQATALKSKEKVNG